MILGVIYSIDFGFVLRVLLHLTRPTQVSPFLASVAVCGLVLLCKTNPQTATLASAGAEKLVGPRQCLPKEEDLPEAR